jgi:hypothetical protein
MCRIKNYGVAIQDSRGTNISYFVAYEYTGDDTRLERAILDKGYEAVLLRFYLNDQVLKNALRQGVESVFIPWEQTEFDIKSGSLRDAEQRILLPKYDERSAQWIAWKRDTYGLWMIALEREYSIMKAFGKGKVLFLDEHAKIGTSVPAESPPVRVK